MKQALILLPSLLMDQNKKKDRSEEGLIRMSTIARKYMEFDKDQVEIWSSKTTNKRLAEAKLLTVFQAYKEDLKNLKTMIDKKELKEEDIQRIGFVTTSTFNKITGTKDNLWVSKSIDDTVIGADPEFILYNGDEIVHADNILSHTGLLGSDGALAELRPSPAITPQELVDNIRKILSNVETMETMKGLTLKAGCYYKDSDRDYPIGGHIHIGNPLKIEHFNALHKFSLYTVMNKIIDEIVAVPMTKIDGPDGATRRTGTKYGKYGFFGGFRNSDGRLEHRTLSGIWLAHPDLSLAVFGVIKTVIDEIFRKIAANGFNPTYWGHNYLDSPEKCRASWYPEFDEWKQIPLCIDLKCILSSTDMTSLLHTYTDKTISNTYMDKWTEKINTYNSSEDYKKEIGKFVYIMVLSAKQLSNLNRDIFKTWVQDAPLLLKA